MEITNQVLSSTCTTSQLFETNYPTYIKYYFFILQDGDIDIRSIATICNLKKYLIDTRATTNQKMKFNIIKFEKVTSSNENIEISE